VYPYYVLNIKRFDSEIDSFSTQYQVGVSDMGLDRPKTTFKKRTEPFIDDFIKYNLSCEIEQKDKIRIYGIEGLFDKFIRVEEDIFYLNKSNNILILSTNKRTFKKFVKDIDVHSNFEFEQLKVNFDKIIRNRNSLGIESVWLGEIPDEVNVHALSMFGSNVENSTNYNNLLVSGAEIKNLSIVYNYQDRQEKIMFTKDGGIIFYNKLDETDALIFIKDLYENVLKPNS